MLYSVLIEDTRFVGRSLRTDGVFMAVVRGEQAGHEIGQVLSAGADESGARVAQMIALANAAAPLGSVDAVHRGETDARPRSVVDAFEGFGERAVQAPRCGNGSAGPVAITLA